MPIFLLFEGRIVIDKRGRMTCEGVIYRLEISFEQRNDFFQRKIMIDALVVVVLAIESS